MVFDYPLNPVTQRLGHIQIAHVHVHVDHISKLKAGSITEQKNRCHNASTAQWGEMHDITMT